MVLDCEKIGDAAVYIIRKCKCVLPWMHINLQYCRRLTKLGNFKIS